MSEKVIIFIILAVIFFHIASGHVGMSKKKPLEWAYVDERSLPSEIMMEDESQDVMALVDRRKSLKKRLNKSHKLVEQECLEFIFNSNGTSKWKLAVFDSHYNQIFHFITPQHVFFTTNVLEDSYFLDPEQDYYFFLQYPKESNMDSKVIKHSNYSNLKIKNEVDNKTVNISEQEVEEELESKKDEMLKELGVTDRIVDVLKSEMINGVQTLKVNVDAPDTLVLLSTNKSMYFKNHIIEINHNNVKKTWKTDIRGDSISLLKLNGFKSNGTVVFKEDLNFLMVEESYILPFYVIVSSKTKLNVHEM